MEDISDPSVRDSSAAGDIAFKFFALCCNFWENNQKQRRKFLILRHRFLQLLAIYTKRRQKRLRDAENFYGSHLKELVEYVRSPSMFHKIFRLTLPTFHELKHFLYHDYVSHVECIPEIDLLIFLYWLSDGASYERVSKFLHIPLSLVKDKIDEVFEKFVSKMSQAIHFPKENVRDMGKRFRELTSCHIFGLVAGCIDTYHVRIQPTTMIDEDEFMNSENELSVQVQVVCDQEGYFMSLAAGFPGGLSKRQILQHNSLPLSNRLPKGYVLLGGFDYPCTQQPICLLPPYDFCDTILKERFNEHLMKANSVMADSVGRMFARWGRIFSKPLNHSLSVITHIIIACSVIHNFCMQRDDPWPEVESVMFLFDKVRRDDEIDDSGSGEKIRNRMSELTVCDDEVQEVSDDYTVYAL